MESIRVTCAVIVNGNRILAVRRSGKMPHPLKWEFPGGKVREGESLAQCLIREIGEELAIDVAVLRPLDVVVHRYPHHTVRLFPFICRKVSGTITLAEHTESRWVLCRELSMTDWLEADREVAGKVQRELCGGSPEQDFQST